ncbi:LAQU0S02e00958g1_1 [Lachancea quebecensis]|uniref:LAQU0S02e00958g1_1 n=1 Tax=Lachancea quebecensis TaxID=1654605 RepID=A0A0P1KMD7_9SACH|nr:LAQU0S02e00958g1_1 [Lachancea quebecensis]
MYSGKEIRILTLLFIDTLFFFLEIVVGYAVHSLALIADSFHMLNDIFSLIIALWAVNVSKNRGADASYTYGWKRAEILGALVNAVFLIALCVSILIEAIQRFFQPQEIENPKLVLIVGCLGLASNLIGLVLFHEHGHSHGHSHSYGESESLDADYESGHGHSHASASPDESSHNIGEMLPSNVVESYSREASPLLGNKDSNGNAQVDHEHKKNQKSLNMHGVFLHVLGDALGNVGVIATALFIWKTQYSWRFYTDPAVSLLITVIIFSSALPLSFKASRILLQATPSSVSADEVKQEIMEIPGVVSVHDFHIWNLTESLSIASIHVEIESTPDEFITVASLIRSIFHRHNIHSATVQPEFVSGNVSDDTYKRFSRIAGGGVYGSSSLSLRNDALDRGNAAYGATSSEARCIFDEAANCNTDNCLPSEH